jgi:uncharacterized coiled-coil protein SlyX
MTMSDLIDRLRNWENQHPFQPVPPEKLMYEAADRIAELEGEVERLRNNLRWIRDNTDSVSTRFYCNSALAEKDDE